jgi:hypothetical protein
MEIKKLVKLIMKQYSHQKWARHKKRLHRKRKHLRKCKRSIRIIQDINKESSIIDYLAKLDLAKRPVKEIKIALKQYTPPIIIVSLIDIANTIERAVVNTKKEPVFHKASRISYPPKEKNKDYNRASTPNHVMFYGGIAPPEELYVEKVRLIVAAEMSASLRNPGQNGTEFITFGKWGIKDSINLVLFVDPNKEYQVPYLQKAVVCCKEWIAKKDTDNSERIQKELTFFANEFAKYVEKDENYNYMISALLTKKLLTLKKYNIDGVMYPSVQTDGEGLCVAISPNAVDEKLELIKVLQCKLTINGNKVNLENKMCCNVDPPNSDFQLTPCEQ